MTSRKRRRPSGPPRTRARSSGQKSTTGQTPSTARAGRGLPSTRGDPRHPAGDAVALKADRERDVGGRTRHVGLGERRVLAPEQQVAAAGGPRRAGQRERGDRLEQVGLALRVLAMNDIESRAEAHRRLGVVAKAVHAEADDRAARRCCAGGLGSRIDGRRVDAHAARPAIDAINPAMRRVASGRAAALTAARMVASVSDPGAASSATASTSCSSRGT